MRPLAPFATRRTIMSRRNAPPEAFPFRPSHAGIWQTINDFGRHGCDGPMPPKEHGPHRYCFGLIALDIRHLPLLADAAASSDVANAALAHRLTGADLVGLYER